MPLQRLPLMELDWQLPAVSVVAAAVLDAQLQHVSAVRNAEREAVAIVKAAGRKAEQIIRQAYRTQRQLQEAAHVELIRSQQEMCDRCEAQWLASHVVSLRNDERVEQRVVQAVSERIRASMEQVLIAWFHQQSIDDTLCARLTAQVEKMAAEGALTLHIHPEMAALAHDKLGTRLTIGINPALAPDEAILASSQLSVSFSLSRHFQQLMGWLRTPCDDEHGDAQEYNAIEGGGDGEE